MAILSSGKVKMTSLLEKIIAVIAPHRCFECGIYNNILCSGCVQTMPLLDQACCVICSRPSVDWGVCAPCSPDLSYIWPSSDYDGSIKAAISALKFQHARAAVEPLVACLERTVPYLEASWMVCSIPTVAKHIRQRGYDQAALLAQAFARQRELPYVNVLVRQTDARQIGATRLKRQAQARTMFVPTNLATIKHRKILLIDDVCTTGATLTAAARTLRISGAKQVAAAVVAWKR